MRTSVILWTGLGALGLLLAVGCESEEHDRYRHRPDAVSTPVYVAEPGYYYDPEYTDAYGYYHPRTYYYYDGHRYERRDAIPRDWRERMRERPREAREEWRDRNRDRDRDQDRDRDRDRDRR